VILCSWLIKESKWPVYIGRNICLCGNPFWKNGAAII